MNKSTDIRALAPLLALAVAAGLAAAPAGASGPSSANYAIPWDTLDGGGGAASSTSYALLDSVAQTTALGTSVSTNYILTPGFHAPPDFDGDSLRNFLDNCIFEANSDQRDTNGDGFGNICDPDLNNDGVVNPVDLGIIKSVFFTSDPDADLNGDGAVNPIDLGIVKAFFFSAPGPSGIN